MCVDHGAQAVACGAVRCPSQVLDRGAQADVRGATHVLDRGAQAVARGAARWFAPAARSAETDACGRSFAVLSTQVSQVGLRLRLNRLTCGSMHEISRDAAVAGEEELVSLVVR